MPRGLALRQWQIAALLHLESSSRVDFLAVATPGSGKTTFALAAARRALVARRARRVVVVVPTQHLKHQWAAAAERFGLAFEASWAAADGALPADVHGVAVTYQQVASSAAALAHVASDAFVILDEVHHTGESRAWGDGVRQAFAGAARRLSLSGTPFRSDDAAIPFVRYEDGEAQPDYEYGYGDALGEQGIVRPVYFPRINGRMEWTAPDGTQRSHTFDDALGHTLANQRLRTALSLHGDWLPAVLGQAQRQLQHLRASDPRAAGMVIAMDQEHARGIAAMLRGRFDASPIVATSDDPGASEAIARFTERDEPWIVAVRMVSEGVDIPRLRVGVFATNTTTDLFFRQAVGRLVRWTAGQRRQSAYMFIPDDHRLRTWAHSIRVQRRHSLRTMAEDGEAERAVPPPEAGAQLSLFAAISAVALDEQGRVLEEGDVYDEALDPEADGVDDDEAGDDLDGAAGRLADAAALPAAVSPGVPLEASRLHLEPLPAQHGGPPEDVGAAGTPSVSSRASRRQLRDLNSARVRALVHRTGLDHASVNAELNRRAGIRRITEATEAQLRRRLALADAWLAT